MSQVEGAAAAELYATAVASVITRYRHDAGLTQAELASAAGLSARSIVYFEAGERNIGLRTLSRIAAALRIPLYRLVLEIEETHRARGDRRAA